MLGFWEKLAKLEAGFAKGVEDLCGSRGARLQRMFGADNLESVPFVCDGATCM